MENNPDHYKYMPHLPGEEKPEQQPESAEEEIVVVEETVTVEETAPVDNQRNETKEPSVAKESGAPSAVLPFENDVYTSINADSLPALKVVYNIFSPLLVPTYITLFIFLFSVLALIAPGAAAPYALTVFGASGVVPAIALYVLLKIGAIDSLSMRDKSERMVPYIIEFLVLGGLTLFFIFKGAAPWLWTIFCGGTAVVLLNFFINFRIRISGHCSAMGALIAALIVIQMYGAPQHPLFWWMVGAFFFTGLVGTAAMIVGRHSIWEVLAGYATGFLGIILFSLIN